MFQESFGYDFLYQFIKFIQFFQSCRGHLRKDGPQSWSVGLLGLRKYMLNNFPRGHFLFWSVFIIAYIIASPYFIFSLRNLLYLEFIRGCLFSSNMHANYLLSLTIYSVACDYNLVSTYPNFFFLIFYQTGANGYRT